MKNNKMTQSQEHQLKIKDTKWSEFLSNNVNNPLLKNAVKLPDYYRGLFHNSNHENGKRHFPLINF